MYNSDVIRKRFENTIYTLGFEHSTTKDNDFKNKIWNWCVDAICFGYGWRQVILYTICIYPDKIVYERYDVMFNNFRIDGDKEKIVDYTDDFYIPDTIEEFKLFVNKDGE